MKNLIISLIAISLFSCKGGRQPAPQDPSSVDSKGSLDGTSDNLGGSGDGPNASDVVCNTQECDSIEIQLEVTDSNGAQITDTNLQVASTSGARFEFAAKTADPNREVAVIIATPTGTTAQGNGEQSASLLVSQLNNSSTPLVVVTRDLSRCLFLSESGAITANCSDFSNIIEDVDKKYNFTLSSSAVGPTNPVLPSDPNQPSNGGSPLEGLLNQFFQN